VATNALRSQTAADLALGSLVNPYVIAGTAFCVAALLSVRSGIAFAPLLVTASFLAGWSSAWSP
jgi:hypothetical protein